MKDLYNEEKPSVYLFQFDCNNQVIRHTGHGCWAFRMPPSILLVYFQYGLAMKGFLPTGNFRWLPSEELQNVEEWTEKIIGWEDDASTGCALEVDLEYPKELFEKHNSLPIIAEKMKISEDMLSSYQLGLAEKLNTKIGGEKLCLALTDKTHYICHYRALKFYLSQGIKLKKIHQVLQFNQSDWLKPYIELNTKLRQNATNQAEKNFAKLMINSFFGKTAENTRNHKTVKLTTKPRTAEKMIAKPSVRRWKTYEGRLAAFLLRRTRVTLNKPRYIGFTVLEDSKLTLNNFHYNFFQPLFGIENVKVCHIDTGRVSIRSDSLTALFFADSFTYSIETELDPYLILKDRTDWIDYSNYPKTHPCYSKDRELEPGYFKDEGAGKIMTSFVGLRSKMYSLQYLEGGEKLAAKGVLSSVRRKQLQHSLYKDTLFEESALSHQGKKIVKKEQQLYTASVNKISLACFTDKIYVERINDNFVCNSLGYCTTL